MGGTQYQNFDSPSLGALGTHQLLSIATIELVGAKRRSVVLIIFWDVLQIMDEG